ncbi:hypothetical protein [Polymorphospora rubra]|uniref:Uncharacterized protein n=1 Tax=Polymorphospora rubra TaxID=338584 RepID=A0A810N897_9ACTN|nr:hypothetical protein [Polymorphospora rubra]BCJ67625.1 hypothetical protein Prubr_46460 [Polymorphospora rubra]
MVYSTGPKNISLTSVGFRSQHDPTLDQPGVMSYATGDAGLNPAGVLPATPQAFAAVAGTRPAGDGPPSLWDQQEAWQNSLLFAQDANSGQKLTDPSNPAYWTGLQKHLAQCGWTTTSYESLKWDQSKSGTSINVIGIMADILGAYLGITAGSIESMFDALRDAADPGATNFRNVWWQSASVHEHRVQAAVGPLTIDQSTGMAKIWLVYYSFDFSASSFESLFVEHDSSTFKVNSFGVQLGLAWDGWLAVKDQVTAATSKVAKDSIANTVLAD